MPGLVVPDSGSSGISGSIHGMVKCDLGGVDMISRVCLNETILIDATFSDPATGAKTDPSANAYKIYDRNGNVIATGGLNKIDTQTGFYGVNVVISSPTYVAQGPSGYVGPYRVYVYATVGGVLVHGYAGQFDVVEGSYGRQVLDATGFDKLTVTTPTSFPTTMGQKILALCARFNNKHTRDRSTGTISVYADDHTTVALQQTGPVDSSTATTDTIGYVD